MLLLFFVWQKHNRQVNAFCKSFVGRAVSFIKNSSSRPSFFMFLRYITCQPVLHQPNSLEFMMVASDIFMSLPAFYLPLGLLVLYFGRWLKEVEKDGGERGGRRSPLNKGCIVSNPSKSPLFDGLFLTGRVLAEIIQRFALTTGVSSTWCNLG